jgi:hypothetical protein
MELLNQRTEAARCVELRLCPPYKTAPRNSSTAIVK